VGKTREIAGDFPPRPDWSSWRRLAGNEKLSAPVLAETLDGGQAFRWQRQPDGSWRGLWSNHVVELRGTLDGTVEWSAPSVVASRVEVALPKYWGAPHHFDQLADQLPWRSDAHLAACLAAFPGLRILRQPFGETLLGFLCSATKQIVQIKQMVSLLAVRHGAPIAASSTPLAGAVPAVDATHFHQLPTWEEIAQIPEATLRGCLLGFRARYIAETSRYIAAHPGWLEETEAMPYAAAKARLCSLPGVGEKVADCVLLFGAGRLEAFPVDVWILKTMARRYGLDDWRPAQVAHFGRLHFGPLAGLAQQYLFAWERRAAKNKE